MTPAFGMSLVVVAGLILTLAILLSRNRKQQLLHVERMAALEKGVPVPVIEPARPWSPRVYLLRGLIWSFSGAALMICLLGLSASPRRPTTAYDRAVEAGRLSKMTGIPLAEAEQIVTRDRTLHDDGLPASVALLGLIPLGVGLAYLVFYYTGETRTPAAAVSLGESIRS